MIILEFDGKKYNLNDIFTTLGYGIKWERSESATPSYTHKAYRVPHVNEHWYFGANYEPITFDFEMITPTMSLIEINKALSLLKSLFYNTKGNPREVRYYWSYDQVNESKFRYARIAGEIGVTYGTDFHTIKIQLVSYSRFLLSEELYESPVTTLTATDPKNIYIENMNSGIAAQPIIQLLGKAKGVEVWLNDTVVRVGDMDGEINESANNLLLGTETFDPIVTLYQAGFGDYKFVKDSTNLKITNSKGYYGDQTRFAWPLTDSVLADGSYMTLSANIKSGFTPPVRNTFIRFRFPYTATWTTLNPQGVEGSGVFEHFEASVKLPNNGHRLTEIYIQVANILQSSGEFASSVVLQNKSLKLERGGAAKAWTPSKMTNPGGFNYLLGTGDFDVIPKYNKAGFGDYVFDNRGANLKVMNTGGFYGDQTRFAWPLSRHIDLSKAGKMTLTAKIKSGYEPAVKNGHVRFRFPFMTNWITLNPNGFKNGSTFEEFTATFTIPVINKVVSEIYFQVANLAHPSGTFPGNIIFQNMSMKLESGATSTGWDVANESVVEIDTERFVVRKNLKDTSRKVPLDFLLVPGGKMRVRASNGTITIKTIWRNTYL